MRFLKVLIAALVLSSPALAQTGTVTNHAFALGKGPGVTGFTSLLCTSAQLAVGQAAADPICQTISGDVTISAGGVTAIGATKVTSAMLNADVFSTAHSWAGQQTFTAPVLGTPASGTLTNATGLPVATGISGLGTGVATFLTTPSSANLALAMTDKTGTGVNVFATSPTLVTPNLGTPSAVTLTNATGLPLTTGVTGNLPNANLSTMASGTVLANSSAGSATPTASTATSWFDRAYCSTVGYIIARTTGGWVCSNNIPVNARWIGATGNGSTDDTTALQSCITTAAGLHGSCYIPAGQYVQTTALSVTSHVNIFGDGVQSIAGLCSFNTNCSTNVTAGLAANATTLLPASGINSITVSGTNDAVQIHDLQVLYATLPAVGSGITGISVSGTGIGSFGVCSATRLSNLVIIQADVGISINNCMSWWVDHNVIFNFRTAAISVGGSIGSGGNDWSIDENRIISGAATTNTCYGVLVTTSAASAITNNKFNFIPGTTNCASIMYLPGVNGTSFEPVRITGNSLEGSTAGIVFYNNCPTASTCSLSQGLIANNQIWTGAGFGGGPNIYVTGAATASWFNEVTITGNILNVVGGGSNNFNIILGAGFAQNILMSGNLFGNTSAVGSTSVFSGAGNLNIKTTGNHVLASDNQSIGTGNTSPFTLACGSLATNTLYNAVQVNLAGGTGVTAIAKNGNSIITQASAPLSPFSMVLNVGETLQLTCTTVPTATYAAFNP
jgi:hypothetical protein